MVVPCTLEDVITSFELESAGEAVLADETAADSVPCTDVEIGLFSPETVELVCVPLRLSMSELITRRALLEAAVDEAEAVLMVEDVIFATEVLAIVLTLSSDPLETPKLWLELLGRLAVLVGGVTLSTEPEADAVLKLMVDFSAEEAWDALEVVALVITDGDAEVDVVGTIGRFVAGIPVDEGCSCSAMPLETS